MRVLGFVFGLMMLAAGASAAPKVGKPAPDFTAMSASGEMINLADYSGKTVVLEWTNHGCPFVQKHYGSGNMQALQKQAAAEGIVWLSVISSAPGKQGNVSAEEAIKLTETRDAAPMHVLLDPEGKVGKLYKAKTTPHMFVIDGEGVVRYMGAIDNNSSANPAKIKGARNHVQMALADLAADRPVEVAKSRPYGCSVKY